jgi:Mrp family chromosome partitioning ATPase
VSHIAEALRKSREDAFDRLGAPDIPAGQQEDTQSWLTAEIPWELDDAQMPTTQVGPTPASPSSGGDDDQDIASGRTRALRDFGHGWQEQLAPLVNRMLQEGPAETRIRSVLFTAIAPERSARLCAATGDALAQHTSGSVCLLDANLREPSLHASFGLGAAPGLSELLLRRRHFRACVARLTTNLWLLPVGTLSTDAVPVLAGERMREHVRQLTAAFDYVLLDSSPASLHRDAVTLGALVDAAVLVIGANASRREVAKRTIDQLRASNVTVLGAILTNRDFPIPEALYRVL